MKKLALLSMLLGVMLFTVVSTGCKPKEEGTEAPATEEPAETPAETPAE